MLIHLFLHRLTCCSLITLARGWQTRDPLAAASQIGSQVVRGQSAVTLNHLWLRVVIWLGSAENAAAPGRRSPKSNSLSLHSIRRLNDPTTSTLGGRWSRVILLEAVNRGLTMLCGLIFSWCWAYNFECKWKQKKWRNTACVTSEKTNKYQICV